LIQKLEQNNLKYIWLIKILMKTNMLRDM